MKKYITYLLATALVGSAFVSCSKRIQEGEMRISTHKVHFSVSDVETRTGLSIDGTTVTPDWNKTALESIHLFEIDANDAVAYGETIAITPSEDNTTAHFEADFPTDMSIIVDPSDPEEDSGAKGTKGTKGTRVSPYRYAAIIAQKPDKNNFTFVVPAEQHPDAETLKDPDADFLIGYSRKAYDTEHFFDEPVVDLYFDRVAALGRLAISNFAEDDGMVKSVTINAQNGLTGSASYADIDFENGKVNFVREEGPGAIALVYDGGMDIPADGPFYAYFVAIPGSATITSVEVVTDHYRYTKTIEGGKELTFSEKAFKSMNLDLSTAEKEEAAPSVPIYRKVTSTTDLVAGSQYLLVFEGDPNNSKEQNHDPKVFRPTLASNGNTFNKQTTDALAVEIVDGTITSDAYEACHFTLEDGYYLKADAVGMYIYPTGSSSGSGTLSAESSATNNLTISFNDGIAQIKAQSGTNYLVWSTSSYYFSSNANVEGDYSTGICLYVLDDGRQSQTLSFSPAANAEYDLHTSNWTVALPTLNGAHTSVTYALSEDSNPSVATVDADGTVHPLSRGTVTIVATAEGNAQYRAASATYTLKVVDSSITINTYYKVTSTSDLETGAQYLLVYEGGSKVFKPILESSSSTTFSKSTDNALSAEISGGTISSNEFENCHLTLESGYYLKADAAGKYLYPDVASSRGVLSAESTASHSLNITIGNNGIASIITKTGTYYLVWSTSSNYFSSNTDIEGEYSTGICLYKLDDGRLPQTLSFSPNEVNYDMAGSDALVKPTLSNAIGTVTYSSSDEAIATVDPSSGDVTVKKKGTVEITASAAGNSQYKPGSASYTLIITNSSITIPTWYKAEEMEAGETYLVVSHDYALNNDGSSGGAAVLLEGVGNTIQYDAPETMIWTATNESSGKFRLTGSDGKVIRLSSSSFQIGTASSTESNNQWSLDADGLVKSGNYFLYYSTSQNKWAVSNSASDSHTGYLYASSPGRAARNLAFSSMSVTHDLATQGTNVQEPTLSGVTDGVEYSSKNTSIATVNAATGEVTLAGKTGTVVITASAPKTDT
ncbi:MAG: Ig-like domain-containing protein, partial [Bacteroidales bacterium]|nr:Ig-like domain-containing protein [Bacteroidales bacterium]